MPATVPAERPAVEGSPSREMALLLVAATASGEQARAAWAAWLDAVDVEDLEPGATAVLGLLGRTVGDLGADPSIVGRVRGVHRQMWVRNQLLWAAGARLVDRLAAGAAVPLVLPPTALLAAYDGDWGARPLGPIHLALPPASVDLVRAALSELGWDVGHLTPTLRSRTRAGLVARWQSADGAGNRVIVSWHVLGGISSSVADEQLRGAAVAGRLGATPIHLLHPADALLERLWNRSHGTFDWIADAVQLARRLTCSGAIEHGVDRFATRARELGIHAIVRERLELVEATVADPAVRLALDALRATSPRAASALWELPGAARAPGRALAGHVAGQGGFGGLRSLVRAQWVARQLRSRGSAQRR